VARRIGGRGMAPEVVVDEEEDGDEVLGEAACIGKGVSRIRRWVGPVMFYLSKQ